MGTIYDHLSIGERALIQTQLGMGIKPGTIARGMNRSASTITRELVRNGWVRPQGAP
jgi:IS30 family transposase